jgi:Putative restriction endonuclease
MALVDPQSPAQRRYVRTPCPIVFPVEEDVPESKRHLELRTALYLILKFAIADRAVLGSDQFVYWDPTNPRACLAPDLLVKVGKPDEDFDTWKVWERGAPDIAVEIASRSDAPEMAWEEKLERYRKVGLKELVRFDWKQPTTSLRIYENIDGDLVERTLEGDNPTRSSVLPYHWVVVNSTLRLAEDAGGTRLLPTYEERAQLEAARAQSEAARAQSEAARAQSEAARAQSEAARAQSEAARAQSEAARADNAEAELVELRAELAKLRRG